MKAPKRFPDLSRYLARQNRVDPLLDRRDFLRVSAVAGGGLLMAVALDGCEWKPQGAGASSALPPADAKKEPALFVRVGADDTITVTVARSEMGQGIRTTFALLVAEELDADWSKVKVETASFDPRYGAQGTGGSSSVLESWQRLREAGATTRLLLIGAAAAKFGVPASELTTDASQVMHASSGRKASYGSLVDEALKQPMPAMVTLKTPAQFRLLGKERTTGIGLDAPDIVHGRAKYGIDVKLPGMLHASIERTRTFGGKVKSFDASRALKVPGVKQVFEVPAIADGINTHSGVAVIADNTWAAMEGRRALTIEWEPGPHASESSEGYHAVMRAAVEKKGDEKVHAVGDPDPVLARAAKVISAVYEVPFISHATMEPMNCTASVKDGKAELWSPTQFPDMAANSVAQVLKIDIKNVAVHVPLMGGGFGRRINPDFSVEAALISQKLGQPVKVTWTRTDDLQHDFYRPCGVHKIEASLDAAGFPEAWRHRMSTPSIDVFYGPKPANGWGANESDGASNMLYRVPNRAVEYTLVESGVPRGWWRAVSTTHTTFAVESFIDELALAAGKDPVEFRLALIDKVPAGAPNLSKDFPHSPERLKGVIKLAAEKASWGKPLPKGHAMGIACVIDHFSYCAEVVEVSVTGTKIKIERVVCAADCGPVMNPNGARSQLEGGIHQALSVALKERITVANGAVQEKNFDGYQLLRMNESVPVIETYFVETDTPLTGLGEPAVPPLAPALANAIARATGRRLRSLPLEL